MSYFLLNGAYNEISLHNSSNPIQDIKYPCVVSYPYLSVFSPSEIDKNSLPTHYDNMHQAYQFKKPCPYCNTSYTS